ncbi:MAG: hypothetical protein WDN76_10365 [Alphaproteobacteria bacterium]
MRVIAAMMLALSLAACATKYPGEPASAHDDERFGGDPVFVLGIDVGRMGIFNDRIASAGELVETPATGGDELIGVSRKLRVTTLEFLARKERLCDELKFTAQSCAAIAPPAWLAQDPNEAITPHQLLERIEAVQELMGPLMDVACETGKAKSKDEMFCSVE